MHVKDPSMGVLVGVFCAFVLLACYAVRCYGRKGRLEMNASILPSKSRKRNDIKFVELPQIDEEMIGLTAFDDANSFDGQFSDDDDDNLEEFGGDDLLAHAHDIMRKAAEALEETRRLDDEYESGSFDDAEVATIAPELHTVKIY